MSPTSPAIHLLDGGLGTLLTDTYNITFDASTPLWSSHLLLTSSGRETLLCAHRAFVDAGADVVLSATYQVSFRGFGVIDEGIGRRKEAEGLMRRGVGIAGASFGGGSSRGRGKVALSLGAYGATMVPGAEYSGVYDEGFRSVVQLGEWHAERIRVFGCGGGSGSGSGEEGDEKEKEKRECWDMVDFVAFETIPRLEEVLAVRGVMDKLPQGMERDYWISCVFPGEGSRLPDGSTIREVVGAMLGGERRRPRGIGMNCTRVGKVEGLVREFEDAVCDLGLSGEVALVMYPDGTRGEVYNTSTQEWEKIEGVEESEVPWDEMVFGNVTRARDRGVWKEIFVGGCCKTTPDHIAKLRKRIDEIDDV